MRDTSLKDRLRRLEIQARYLATSQLTGHWASNIPGTGLDYKDLREYVPGDDLRRLDWKATARTGRPYLRQYHEERQQVIHLALDLSASMNFGQKTPYALDLLALLGWTAVLQKDQFALAGFTDRIDFTTPPRRGEANLWAEIENLCRCTPPSKKTALAELWRYWFHTLTHRSTCVVLSDFQGDWDEARLKALCLRHDLWLFHIQDPWETGEIDSGLAALEDPETRQKAWVDTTDPEHRRRFQEAHQARSETLRQMVHNLGGWYLAFSTTKEPLPLLMEFLQRRETLLHA